MTATPATTTLPATMTVREASTLLGISLRATYRLVEAGQLPVLRMGRRIHVITHKLYTMLGLDPAAHPVPEVRADWSRRVLASDDAPAPHSADR